MLTCIFYVSFFLILINIFISHRLSNAVDLSTTLPFSAIPHVLNTKAWKNCPWPNNCPYFTDKVYDENTQTLDVYNDIAKPVVEAATTGINGTIFAYGQTSSGKTYTMTGMDGCPGIIPLAVYDLFDIIKNKEDRDFLLRYFFFVFLLFRKVKTEILNTCLGFILICF